MIEVHGYAFVSDDDRIADAGGETPASLRNDADWAYFQAELDRAGLVVLGRLGHAVNPNPKRRRRLVLSSRVADLEERADAWWWNPAGLPWGEAAARVLPGGGRVAVPGGRRVFDLFLAIGYDAFHLARAAGVRVGPGVSLFEACDRGRRAEEVLAGAGLAPGHPVPLDPAAGVSLTVWERRAPP